MKILLVEDEKRIASFVERGLKEERYLVDVAHTGEDGLFAAEVNEYDLIILDIMLPDRDGVSVCKALRSRGLMTPILMLTAKGAVKDKVRGLDAGADDYMTKPFSFEEFLARVRALLRQHKRQKTTELCVHDVVLDQLTHRVTRAGQEIMLANKEYQLLEYFMLHVDQVVTRTMISEHVWHESFDRMSNVFDVYVHRLRKKIDKGFDAPLIHSIRGVGYMMKVPVHDREYHSI